MTTRNQAFLLGAVRQAVWCMKRKRGFKVRNVEEETGSGFVITYSFLKLRMGV